MADTREMGSAMGMADSFVNFACLWFKVLSHKKKHTTPQVWLSMNR